ncbi:M24 family metallopeptidase [Pelagovum pacificum]|uniref:Aminopeptidase P family protein n=1 Tax=Pelagovum pacificum TaxID=2588711 RepID=A0A5C5GBC8_9RHOB|nr:Xaa-Pro peptidase family protein [Pelagovum pacificum]QQA42174.1 aminopeptidase P family protein [Pelagovum pacificum]TNY31260.1 aminopeptidase P family protein [Pelagovum pacificum]
MSDRFAELRALAKGLGVDAIALVPGPNFTRILGAEFHTNERAFVVIVPASGTPVAVVPTLELASWALVGFEGETYDWPDQTGPADAFAKAADALSLTSVVVEGQVMRVFVHHHMARAWPGLTILDGEADISSLRLCKTDDEIAAMSEAIRISEESLEQTLGRIVAGMSEKEVESLLVSTMFSLGAEDFAFTPIVVAADNSARAHGHARADYALQDGDALLIDFGARWGGLCADITRTFFVGHAGDLAQEVYATVLAANSKGHEVTKAGMTAHDVDDAVMSVLEARDDLGFKIGSKTGHGLGRAVHEDPYMMRGNHQVLQPGMVFTNEPSLKKDGAFGIRIEDDILVTGDGCRSLTTFPRELRIL